MTVEQKFETLAALELETAKTRRPISPGAEKWLGVPIKCLDYGFVYLVDYMGNDAAIEQAARVSYGAGTRKIEETTGLVRYLRRHQHTTPFEMVEFKFHAKMPIFVAREWVRHRTANINEYSGRYSVMSDEFYLPSVDQLRQQSTSNRQGRGEPIPVDKQAKVLELLTSTYKTAYSGYEEMLAPDINLARELARIGLSVANYTEWYWKIDLHNLMHFLKLRMDKRAQWEIRVYAASMAEIVKEAAPIAWQAFEDYELAATQLTQPEKKVLFRLLAPRGVLISREEVLSVCDELGLTNRRERQELLDKFRELGIMEKRKTED